MQKHTVAVLNQEICNILKDYEIEVSSISAFVSDNGANMIATGKKIQENQSISFLQEESNDM